jgi:hypothetical protein
MKGDSYDMTTLGFSLSSYGFCTFSQICLPNSRALLVKSCRLVSGLTR